MKKSSRLLDCPLCTDKDPVGAFERFGIKHKEGTRQHPKLLNEKIKTRVLVFCPFCSHEFEQGLMIKKNLKGLEIKAVE